MCHWVVGGLAGRCGAGGIAYGDGYDGKNGLMDVDRGVTAVPWESRSCFSASSKRRQTPSV